MTKCAPCKGCTERHEACHDHCDRYKEWKQPFLDSYPERKLKIEQKVPVDVRRKLKTASDRRKARR